jgi:hypothetical protein
MRHPNHGSEGNLFKGILVDAARTPTYIPTWILITTPMIYLIYMLLGSGKYLFDLIRQLMKKDFITMDLTDMLMFISGFGAVFFIIFTHVTIYNGWRHCYFAYPCFVYFAVYFLHYLAKKTLSKICYLCCTLLVISLGYNAFWIADNHPFEFVYFSPVFRNTANFYSGDYWSISSRALLEQIIETDPGRILVINHKYSQAGSINRGLFPEEKRSLIELTYDETENVDYYIVCRDDIMSVDIDLDGYKKDFSITVDKDEIGAVFRKKE